CQRVLSMPRVGEQVTVTFAPRGRYRACSSTPGRGTTSNRGCANALARAAVLSCLTCATSPGIAAEYPAATPCRSPFGDLLLGVDEGLADNHGRDSAGRRSDDL